MNYKTILNYNKYEYQKLTLFSFSPSRIFFSTTFEEMGEAGKAGWAVSNTFDKWVISLKEIELEACISFTN